MQRVACHYINRSISLVAVQAIVSADEDLSPLGNLIEDIENLLRVSPGFHIQHAYRTTTHVAHRIYSSI